MEVELEAPLHVRERTRKKEREVQLLKRKNTELATITRKLEEKVKSLEKVSDGDSDEGDDDDGEYCVLMVMVLLLFCMFVVVFL